MDRIETFERFKKIYAKKYKDFEEADKVFRIREYFLNNDCYFEECDFEKVFAYILNWKTRDLASQLLGYMNMNPKLNEFCRIDYEFIQPIKDKINLQYLEIYQVIKDIDLFLNNGKEFDYDLEKLKKLVSNSQNQIFEISKNSLKNMNKKIKEESKKEKEKINDDVYL